MLLGRPCTLEHQEVLCLAGLTANRPQSYHPSPTELTLSEACGEALNRDLQWKASGAVGGARGLHHCHPKPKAALEAGWGDGGVLSVGDCWDRVGAKEQEGWWKTWTYTSKKVSAPTMTNVNSFRDIPPGRCWAPHRERNGRWESSWCCGGAKGRSADFSTGMMAVGSLWCAVLKNAETLQKQKRCQPSIL